MQKEFSVTVPAPSGISVVGLEHSENGPSTLEEAKKNPDTRFFRDVLGLKDSVDIVRSTERDGPERTYRISGNTLHCRLSDPDFSLEARVPFNESTRLVETDTDQ